MHDLIPVNSSAVDRIGYSNGILTVRWKSGTITQYLAVPGYLWELLQGAESKGRFIAKNIKGKFKEAA